jgi:hypothetical protein
MDVGLLENDLSLHSTISLKISKLREIDCVVSTLVFIWNGKWVWNLSGGTGLRSAWLK